MPTMPPCSIQQLRWYEVILVRYFDEADRRTQWVLVMSKQLKEWSIHNAMLKGLPKVGAVSAF